MVYKATQDVVQRVMPLLNQMAERTIDKARLLQYLSARAGVDWGAIELLEETDDGPEEPGGTGRRFHFRDRQTGEESWIQYPSCLPVEWERQIRDEYKRLAVDRPLSVMAEPLFRYFYQTGYCALCRWRGAEHAQIHRECHFAGWPVNFDPD